MTFEEYIDIARFVYSQNAEARKVYNEMLSQYHMSDVLLEEDEYEQYFNMTKGEVYKYFTSRKDDEADLLSSFINKPIDDVDRETFFGALDDIKEGAYQRFYDGIAFYEDDVDEVMEIVESYQSLKNETQNYEEHLPVNVRGVMSVLDNLYDKRYLPTKKENRVMPDGKSVTYFRGEDINNGKWIKETKPNGKVINSSLDKELINIHPYTSVHSVDDIKDFLYEEYRKDVEKSFENVNSHAGRVMAFSHYVETHREFSNLILQTDPDRFGTFCKDVDVKDFDISDAKKAFQDIANSVGDIDSNEKIREIGRGINVDALNDSARISELIEDVYKKHARNLMQNLAKDNDTTKEARGVLNAVSKYVFAKGKDHMEKNPNEARLEMLTHAKNRLFEFKSRLEVIKNIPILGNSEEFDSFKTALRQSAEMVKDDAAVAALMHDKTLFEDFTNSLKELSEKALVYTLKKNELSGNKNVDTVRSTEKGRLRFNLARDVDEFACDFTDVIKKTPNSLAGFDISLEHINIDIRRESVNILPDDNDPLERSDAVGDLSELPDAEARQSEGKVAKGPMI